MDHVGRALEGHVDEEVVAAQWFRPPGGWENKGLGPFGFLFRRKGDKPMERLGSMNVLALTPTRLVAFSGKTGWGGLKLKEQIAEWPVGEFVVGAKQRQAKSTKYTPNDARANDNIESTWRIVKVTVQGNGLDLSGDFPDDERTAALTDAARKRLA